eukprot:CAMPEP_0197829130 /NCGR_PEP_ID=MMETSP1437-20131217/5585_1 /TAXON_ID=49252 ORGANISM="Eucampia antarctica, Strain CCMP1452" /NCGR_SAMPLE_ID=MMETSP1437 /ASSEMBLY_ACC=CAM_ASM_001096 /LENGTH=487 /DNA_ID=CAMNT_0043430633 /DNA_START=36 /DNA_END=1499 /DNA_ORIENTATION=-
MRQALCKSSGTSVLRRQIISHRNSIFEPVRFKPSLVTYSNSKLIFPTLSIITRRPFSNKSDLSVKKDDNLPTIPIDFLVASRVQGEESQTLQINIEPGQKLRAESGAMLYMTQGIEMNTTMGEGGIGSGFKRMLTGQNLFLSDFTYDGDEGSHGTVGLGTDFPSKIIKLDLQDYGGKLVCQKGAFLAGGSDVRIEMEFAKKMTAGFFGGEGFILQSLLGEDTVFIKAGGTLVKKELQQGERLRVSSGCLVAFTQDIDFDVQMMPGFKNVMFGGEGIFITTLTGPGTVWLQGMPPDRMISEISRRIPSGGGIGLGIPIGMGGGGGATEENGDTSDDASTDGEEAVAGTDAAVDADRQATVASSGLTGDDIDSESPESLFGDAASKDVSPPGSSSVSDSDTFGETADFSSESDSDANFGENKTNEEQSFDDFGQDDQTSFSTEFDSEDDFSSGDEFDTENNFGSNESTDEEGGIGSIFGKLWDLFNDDD